MPESTPRWSIPFPLGIVLGLVLIGLGGRALYQQILPRRANPPAGITRSLLCKIFPRRLAGAENPSGDVPNAPDDVSLVSGATLKLTGTPKATIDDTVVVDLCVEAAALPPARQQALLKHLLVQLSAVGLQIAPSEKIPAVAASGPCLGTAAWTVRANTPGSYTAIVLPESIDRQPNLPAATASSPQWDFALDQPAQLNIQFQPEWTDYVQKSWGAISTVLGTVLVFTQVILNLRQRKKASAA